MSSINVKYLIAVLALACLSGCVLIGGHYLHDEPIGEKRVDVIRPGETKIQQVLMRLGPPIAIARPGQTVVFPGQDTGRSDTFFELFSSNRTFNKDEVIYYYQALRRESSGLIVIGLGLYLITGAEDPMLILFNGGGETDRNEAERLWLLVNEKTGLIEDAVYRP
jgi:hypothetical protein